MIKELREKFNRNFTSEIYNNYVGELNSTLKYPVDFRVAETVLFLSSDLKKELISACNEIISELQTIEFKDYSKNAIPCGLEVPNEDEHPIFLQIDFAICKDSSGDFTPRLIELQGFPSLYGFQYYQGEIAQKHFQIPHGMHTYFSGFTAETFKIYFKEILLQNSSPENVILLEIDPEKQKTRIDFAATETLTGIKTVCISKIIKRGTKLFYKDKNKEIPIERIYNRVIIDELLRKKIDTPFNFTDDLDIKWAGHPNWFFKISKHTLPFLKNRYVPQCFFLNQLEQYPRDLDKFVLKPLFSFAGLGVDIEPSKEKLDSIDDKSNYLLQEKIEYAPLIETPDEFSKVEIRMMFLWKDSPLLINNLVRMSKGKMMGVDFNKNKTWVGSSCAFHE
jgi:hypothetical protein